MHFEFGLNIKNIFTVEFIIMNNVGILFYNSFHLFPFFLPQRLLQYIFNVFPDSNAFSYDFSVMETVYSVNKIFNLLTKIV